jgi:cyclic pyranopterin phosphate synthase
MKLVDSFGRIHTSLRLSVTDRCNIRCFYCMPAERVDFLPRPEILDFEEITRAARIFGDLGIRKIRITGGEPLVRRELPGLVRQLRAIAAIEEIAMTTNAILLDACARELKQAGLDRINVSLDTLDRRQFASLTRRDNLPDVLRGIHAAREAGFSDLRLNAVAIKGLTESQIIPLTQFALEHSLKLRFIEFMPLNSTGQWHENDVLTGAGIRQMIETHFGKLQPEPRPDPSQPAVDFRLTRFDGSIGFINSVSEPFCGDCNRVRLTAEGKIRNCLFSKDEWDLRKMLRDGSSDAEIQEMIRDCIAHKKAAHGIGSPDFEKPARAMYQIGG